MWLNSRQATPIFKDILRYYRFPQEVFVGSEERVESLRNALKRAGRK